VYKAIVVGTDGSDTAERAVREAADLARAFSAPLHVVSAYRTTAPVASMAMAEVGGAGMFGDWLYDQRSQVEDQLAVVGRQLSDAGVRATIHAVAGSPVEAILKVAEETEADLIVVGNKGMNGARRVLGSVPNSVAHKAACTVLVVKTC
jgi:nucleotide-binding universal stress UspA family protein